MELEILGCSGGIGAGRGGTTAFLLDGHTLIDCGTGVTNLSLDELVKIDHIFLTHSHMDHIAALPLLIDSVGEARNKPVLVYAPDDVLRILRSHVLNWVVWPDFSAIPDRIQPFMKYQPVNVLHPLSHLMSTITPLPAHHTVPAVGYCIQSSSGYLAYTGDTAYCPEQIAAINALPDLQYLIIETAFPDEQYGLATASRHLCPALLNAILSELKHSPQIFISHLKPGLGEKIMAEVGALAVSQKFSIKALVPGQVIKF